MCTMHVHFHPPRGSLSYFLVPCHCKQQCNEHLWICLLEFLGTVSLGFEHKCGLAGSLSRNFPRWTPPGFFSAERLFHTPLTSTSQERITLLASRSTSASPSISVLPICGMEVAPLSDLHFFKYWTSVVWSRAGYLTFCPSVSSS